MMQKSGRTVPVKWKMLFLVIAGLLLIGCDKEVMSYDEAPLEMYDISVGKTPISEYTIFCDSTLEESAILLQKYIYNVTGNVLTISETEPDGRYIQIATNEELTKEKIEITDGYITIQTSGAETADEAIYIFANTYLGYAFAGQEREWILQTADYINIPENVTMAEDPWMPEREPIVCLWKTDDARGLYSSDNVSLKCDILSYSDEQLYEYVKMVKHCGFTGIQVTDMCSAWAGYGGYEFVHQRIRFIADAAHSMGMNFTLWVWGSEFNGYGWIDDTVVYEGDSSKYARECPEVVATFDKYYSIYAELADCSDRVIMHFNDPGNLPDSGDIGYFADMFRSMCYERNPDINFGINCYTQEIDLAKMKEFTGSDITVYFTAARDEEERESRRSYYQWADDLDMEVGVWSWNLCEMEIDQLAEMNVNANIIAQTYQYSRANEDVVKPEYWSEMDSYHMLNMFSLYVAGQLLQNPDSDPQIALIDCSVRVVGPEYAKDLAEVLDIIQDARSGDSWGEFKYGYPEYLRTSDEYPAQEILDRCNAAIPKLEEMIAADLEENSIPMAISTTDLLSLILPHLVQIRDFAQFRVDLAALEAEALNGADQETLAVRLDEIYTPVKEYNAIIGAWGQPEANAQYELICDFCSRYELEVPHDPVFDYYRKERVYGEMVASQKKEPECYKVAKTEAFQWGKAYGEEETARLVDLLIADGLLLEDENGFVYLSNWENYLYR